MQVHAVSPLSRVIGSPTANGWDIVEVKSQSSKTGKVYRVDMTHGRCSCPAWIFQNSKGSTRAICKHLKALGFKQLIEADEFDYNEKVKSVTQEGVKVKA
jgi:hypothetical protein